MLSIVLTIAAIIVFFFVLYRLLPVFRGRVSSTTEVTKRWYRWNTYVAPHIQRYLETELLVASIGNFRNEETNVQLSISTWSLHPTVISDVDFIAIANPSTLSTEASILGFIGAAELRKLLGGLPEGQLILGHRVWTYVWPESVDQDVLGSQLLTPEAFRSSHGLVPISGDEGEDP